MEKYKEFLDDQLPEEDPSEDLEFLFASGRIEQLVREGRIPLKIGTIGAVGGEMRPYYQVPPRGFKPENISQVYMSSAGAYIFVYKDGSQRIGSTYTMTEEQSKLLQQQVETEKEFLEKH